MEAYIEEQCYEVLTELRIISFKDGGNDTNPSSHSEVSQVPSLNLSCDWLQLSVNSRNESQSSFFICICKPWSVIRCNLMRLDVNNRKPWQSLVNGCESDFWNAIRWVFVVGL